VDDGRGKGIIGKLYGFEYDEEIDMMQAILDARELEHPDELQRLLAAYHGVLTSKKVAHE